MKGFTPLKLQVTFIDALKFQEEGFSKSTKMLSCFRVEDAVEKTTFLEKNSGRVNEKVPLLNKIKTRAKDSKFMRMMVPGVKELFVR
jgi:hypothetical protein